MYIQINDLAKDKIQLISPKNIVHTVVVLENFYRTETVRLRDHSVLIISRIKRNTVCVNNFQNLRFNILFWSEPTERASVPKENLTQSLQDDELRIRCHEDLQSQAQQLVDDINAKRKRDTDLFTSKLQSMLLLC